MGGSSASVKSDIIAISDSSGSGIDGLYRLWGLAKGDQMRSESARVGENGCHSCHL